MNIKKQVYDEIIRKLENELDDLRREIARGKRNVNELADRQKTLKRKKAVLSDVIYSIKSGKEPRMKMPKS
jgi:regulator of replication initiation timing